MKLTYGEITTEVTKMDTTSTADMGRTVELHTDQGIVSLEMNRKDILNLTQALLYTQQAPPITGTP